MIEVHVGCETEVQGLPPDGISYCPDCEHICEGNTHMVREEDEDDIAEWHWMYNHDWNVPDGWLVQSTIGFIRRTFNYPA